MTKNKEKLNILLNNLKQINGEVETKEKSVDDLPNTKNPVSDFFESLNLEIGKKIDTSIKNHKSEVNKTLENHKKEILNKTSSKQEGFEETVFNELSLISEEIDEFREQVEEGYINLSEEQEKLLQKKISEINNFISEALKGLNIKNDTLVNSIEDLSKTLEDTVASTEELVFEKNEETISLLDKAQKDNRKDFFEIFKRLNSIEQDVEKTLKDIYEFGAMLQIQVNGTLVGIANSINFTNGTNTTVATTTNPQGGVNVQINSTGGSGSGYQVPTSGSVNGTNKTFVWATAPNVIVVDGIPLQKTRSDGTENWTGTTTTVLTIAPQNDIFSPA